MTMAVQEDGSNPNRNPTAQMNKSRVSAKTTKENKTDNEMSASQGKNRKLQAMLKENQWSMKTALETILVQIQITIKIFSSKFHRCHRTFLKRSRDSYPTDLKNCLIYRKKRVKITILRHLDRMKSMLNSSSKFKL